MPEHQKREMYAVTPVFFWPVLWWSIIVFEAWMASYEAEHGPAEILFAVTPFGRIRLKYISDRPAPRHTPDLSRATIHALLAAFTPAIMTSVPVRCVILALTGQVIAKDNAPPLLPASLAPG